MADKDDDPKKPILLDEVRRKRAKPPPRQVANYINVDRAMANHIHLADLVAFNAFSNQLVLAHPIPHPDHPPAGGFKPRPWCDDDDVELTEVLNCQGFGKLGKAMVHDVVDLRARRLWTYHPVKQFFSFLHWDGQPRLERWLIDYCGAVIEDERHRHYVAAISRCTLIAAVARIMRPGCKVDTMLILEGSQGTLKSSMLRLLSVEESWFTDSMPHDLASKDARQHLAGKWIVEMPEIAQIRKSAVETLKSFVSCQVDRYRPPYGRSDIAVPRQCILFGTTNEESYLIDPTGNRRFWPVKLTDIDLDAMAANRDQLWAEALAAYDNDRGEQWWLTPEIEAIAAEQQSARVEVDPWTEAIADRVSLRPEVTTAQILEEILDMKKEHWEKADEMRVAAILRNLGYRPHRIMRNGIRARVYKPG